MTGKPVMIKKFGGSTLMTTGRIRDMARLISRDAGRYSIVAVCSAMGKTTDGLVRMGGEVSHRPGGREMDMLLATGEQVSIALMALAISGLGIPAASLTGYQADIVTDSRFGSASILHVDPQGIRKVLDAGKVAVVAGFQGRDMYGNTTTLGRGGSDTTAVALGAVLDAEVVDIYTDVDGVYTADPGIVPEARKIDVIDYEDMMELAAHGAKVMCLRSIHWGHRHGLKIHVKSSFCSADGTAGTIIREVPVMERPTVTSVTHTFDEARVSIRDLPQQGNPAASIFEAIREAPVSIDMIVMNSVREGRIDLAFTLPKSELLNVMPAIQEQAERLGAAGVKFDTNIAKVSIVGRGIKYTPSVAATVFGALRDEGIEIQMVSTSELRLTCVVRDDEAERAVRAIHSKFFVTG